MTHSTDDCQAFSRGSLAAHLLLLSSKGYLQKSMAYSMTPVLQTSARLAS